MAASATEWNGAPSATSAKDRAPGIAATSARFWITRALNARNYSITGQDTPRAPYNHIRFGASFGGPLAIPHLFRTNNGNFFVGYQGMRNRNASTSDQSDADSGRALRATSRRP